MFHRPTARFGSDLRELVKVSGLGVFIIKTPAFDDFIFRRVLEVERFRKSFAKRSPYTISAMSSDLILKGGSIASQTAVSRE